MWSNDHGQLVRTPPSSDIEIQETVNDYGDCCWAELVIEDARGYVGIDARSARGVFGIHVVEQWGIWNDADVSEYDSIASETWKRGGRNFMIESVVRSHCAVCGSSEITAHDIRRTVFSDRLFV